MKPKRKKNTNGQAPRNDEDPRIPFQRETPTDLSGVKAAVLGCGSVGGFASMALASAGVGELLLADKDTLSEDNLRRHVCGNGDVGKSKVDSLAATLRHRYPRLQVRAQNHCFLGRTDLLRTLLAECDIALVAIDNEGPKYVVNDMLWQLRTPAIFTGVYGGGWAAETILVDPTRHTPCYGCAANALGRYGIQSPHADGPPPYAASAYQPAAETADEPEREEDHEPSGGVTNHWIQADLTSILPAAALAADLAIAWLAAEQGSPRRLQELRIEDASVWQLAIRYVPAWGLGPWSLAPVPVLGHAACPQRCRPVKVGGSIKVAA